MIHNNTQIICKHRPKLTVTGKVTKRNALLDDSWFVAGPRWSTSFKQLHRPISPTILSQTSLVPGSISLWGWLPPHAVFPKWGAQFMSDLHEFGRCLRSEVQCCVGSKDSLVLVTVSTATRPSLSWIEETWREQAVKIAVSTPALSEGSDSPWPPEIGYNLHHLPFSSH